MLSNLAEGGHTEEARARLGSGNMNTKTGKSEERIEKTGTNMQKTKISEET